MQGGVKAFCQNVSIPIRPADLIRRTVFQQSAARLRRSQFKAMNRTIRQIFQWSLVITLTVMLGASPVSAGWLRNHLKCKAKTACAPACPPPVSACAAPVCEATPAPVCEAAPAPDCCPNVTYAEPIMSIPADDCCGGEVYSGEVYSGDVYQGEPMMEMGDASIVAPIEGEIYQGGYEHPPMMDDEMMDGGMMDGGMGGSAMPIESATMTPPPIVLVPVESAPVDSPSDVKMMDKAEAAPPVVQPRLEVIAPPVDKMANDEMADEMSGEAKAAEAMSADDQDLFDAPMNKAPVTPTPTPAPATVAPDDLFGTPADSADAMSADAMSTDAMSTDDAMGVDDLFGDTPATPADKAAPMNDAPIDDLFGTPPADAPAGNTPMDDLFGDPAGGAAPADAAPGNASPLDDLFSDPPAGDKPADQPSLDDLFGNDSSRPSSENVNASIDELFGTPATSGTDDSQPELSIDDLFGMLQSGPATVTTPAVEAETEIATEIAAETESVAVATAPLHVVSNVTESIDPLADARERVWVDNTGKFHVEGKLIEVRDDHVRLLKTNGRTCTVPMSRLCDADAAYVASLAAKIADSRIAMLTAK